MKNFNIIMTGVGGQGIITLVTILDQACLEQGYDVKSSELHGLSQRGGSVVTHVRFGKKVYSPLVSFGGADLIVGLELAETLRDIAFAGSKTAFVINDYSMGFLGYPAEQEILDNLNRVGKNRVHLVPAVEICKKELDKDVVAGVYLLGYAVKNNLIPLKKESFIKSLETVIPQKYLDLNIKAFNLAFKQ